MNILKSIVDYKNKDYVRFHTPGHKGRAFLNFLDDVLPYDLTELYDTDNLYSPEKGGAIEKSFKLFEQIYGTANTIFSVGGATLALQTAITMIVKKGRNVILCDRMAHKSVTNAFALCNIKPIWLYQDRICEQIETQLSKLSNIRVSGVLITSPNYYGKMHDISAISSICRRYDIPLLVDNSHGAHLAYYNNGELFAYKNGADIVVDSIHKTLPALTGAALLHANERFSKDEMLTAMQLFASTSPSYLILASIIGCGEYMTKYGKNQLDELLVLVEDTKFKISEIGLKFSRFDICDPFRLCITVENRYNANELYDYLYENGVACEFSDMKNLVLIPSVMNTKKDFDIFVEVCKKYIRNNNSNSDKYSQVVALNKIPEVAMSIREAVFCKSEKIKITKANGRISTIPYAPYPPGVPVIMPGEYFDDGIISVLKSYNINDVDVVGDI